MHTQPPILHTLRAQASRELLETIIDEQPDNRTRLGQKVCTAFGFQDARGGLRSPAASRHCASWRERDASPFRPGQSGVTRSTPVCLAEPVPPPVDVPDTVQGVKDLSLVRVDVPNQRQIWNTLIDREHPLGTTTFVGRQVHYLIDSDHGWLGAIGFSAAALTLNSTSRTDAIGYYLRRWRIEDFFRVLKTGCKAKHLAFRTAQRLERATAIQMVIAWRIMLMTLLGRAVPECPAEWLSSNAELRFLRDYAVIWNKPAAGPPCGGSVAWWPFWGDIRIASMIHLQVTKSCGEVMSPCRNPRLGMKWQNRFEK